MEKEEILEKSRRENGNRDLAEMSTVVQAGAAAGRVGAGVCCLISIVALQVAGVFLCGPWIIYSSIVGTYYLVRYTKTRQWTDLVVACLGWLMCVTASVFFVIRLAGGAV